MLHVEHSTNIRPWPSFMTCKTSMRTPKRLIGMGLAPGGFDTESVFDGPSREWGRRKLRGWCRGQFMHEDSLDGC